MKIDLASTIKVLGTGVFTQSDNTARNVSVDLLGNKGVAALVSFGTIADADTTFTVLVEESDDNSAWASAPTESLIGTTSMGLQFDSDNKTGKIGYKGIKRYFRVRVAPANNTGQVEFSITIVGLPLAQPHSSQVS